MTNIVKNKDGSRTIHSKAIPNENAYFYMQVGDIVNYLGHSEGGRQRIATKEFNLNVDTGETTVVVSSDDAK